MCNVTFRQLQIFVAVAERLSLARVAEQLHLTPSAISFQIKQIEEQAGFALFERIGKKVSLTDAGSVLLTYARVVLQSLHDADQAMLALKGVRGGRIKLGLVSTAKYIVPHMIARFREQYSDVAVLLRDANRREILDMLTSGEIDLAVMGQPPDGADVSAERFADHPSVIIAPAEHPLRNRDRLPASALAQEWFVIREEGAGTRTLTDDFFRSAGFLPRVAMESSSNETIKQSVIAGMGLALISQHTISLELSLGFVTILPVAGFPLMRSWFVAHRRTLPLLPIQARLRDFLIEQGQSVIDGISRNHANIGAALPKPAATPVR
jgi:LysR family transcriptional regulator, low CO2-responsive transcriptional regulator